jgi:L-seryl-tRNA(Ser) seleniumtransferase
MSMIYSEEKIMSGPLHYPTYESLGVRPLVNAKGTYTIISGSLVLPEVRQAMSEASKRYVNLDELMEAVGARIAELMQCEWGLVTNGCAAALCQVTAACIAGTDPEKMAQLPSATGLRNEVLVQPSHRHVYDHAVRMTGAKLIEVETRQDLEAALSDRTAMLLVFGDAAERGQITVAEMAEIGHQHGVPTLVDAAAERPDLPNWYLEQGADAVGYSGGKCLRGPQAAGLVLGRKELLQAAFLNAAPHHALARPMKVGKEEIMGMMAAVEQWGVRDHQAEWTEWERRLSVVSAVVEKFPSVQTQIHQPGRSNVAPTLGIHWDPSKLVIGGADVAAQLAEGEPRIEVFSSENGFSVNPYMMEADEEQILADRINEIMSAV